MDQFGETDGPQVSFSFTANWEQNNNNKIKRNRKTVFVFLSQKVEQLVEETQPLEVVHGCMHNVTHFSFPAL